MLTKKQIQHLRSLKDKKYRHEFGQFMAEGEKIVIDLIASGLKVYQILLRSDYHGELQNHPKAISITLEEMKRITAFKTPSAVCGVFELPLMKPPDFRKFKSKWLLALDGLSDAGNLGTLLRTADWFDIKDIVCSNDSVDVFNPKCVQSSMGSIARVNVIYDSLEHFLQKLPEDTEVLGADMCGENLYSGSFPEGGVIILGSEARGIRPELRPLISRWVSIPRFETQSHPESLNVAIAGSIIISELCSKHFRI